MTEPLLLDPVTEARRVFPKPSPRKSFPPPPDDPPDSAQRYLVFDCETTVDPTQRLIFGVARYYVDDLDAVPLSTCVAECIFHNDDLPKTDPAAFTLLQHHVAKSDAATFPGRSNRIELLSRSEFVEQWIFKFGVRHRATTTAFNADFDLTRIAVDAGHARRSAYGGFSLRLWQHEGGDHQYRPRVTLKSIDSKRSLIRFTSTNDRASKDYRYQGRFLDTRTLAFALSGAPGSLESCCRDFGVAFAKQDVVHGTVTPDYIEYARQDVDATARLAQALLIEFAQHPIDLAPTKALSPASIGKAYLTALGIKPVLERQPDFPIEVCGFGMDGFGGGRCEAHARRQAVPVVYADFRSMYPSVNSLMENWRLITARRIDCEETTQETQRLLNRTDLSDYFGQPDAWKDLACLVQLIPNGDVLPIRANYDPATPGFGIGVNPATAQHPSWYALADVVASAILTGRTPNILRAITLGPKHRQGGLQPLKLRGVVPVNPRNGDFFRTVIEQRTATRNNNTLDPATRDRTQRFLKVLANSTSYGVFAELTPKTQANEVDIELWSGTGEPWTASTTNPETPGRWCFPPLAACITAAARLMLALLEHHVTSAGGTYAFCDTDSMAIVATRNGGERIAKGVKALSWSQVDDIVARFETLNPYDRTLVPGSVLEIEAENFDADGQQQELWCWAISAKRYCLFTRERTGEVVMQKVSEHGLGHLLAPDGNRQWFEQAWRFLLSHDLDLSEPEPPWLDRPALSQVTISGSTIWRWFDEHNTGRPYDDKIKPANFVTVAYPDRLSHPDAAPIAAFTTDVANWQNQNWFDRNTGQSLRLTVADPDGTPSSGVVRVQSYRDVLAAYIAHPEHKSLGPDNEPVSRDTKGLLRRRPVHLIWPPRYIGREANRLTDQATGLLNPDEALADYTPDTHDWEHLVLPLLRHCSTKQLASDLGTSRRSIQRWCSGQNVPPHDMRQRAAEHLQALFAQQISALGRRTPTDQRTALWLANQAVTATTESAPT